MSTSISAPPAPEPAAPLSFVQRCAGVFFSPRETFAEIARQPDFIGPLVISIMASVAMTETMLTRIGMERIIRMSIERSSRASSMSPEQIEQAVNQGAKVGAVFAHLGGLLGPAVVLLIIAGLGLLILNGIFGAQVKFATVFAVTCYANLVGILGIAMAIAVILFGDPEHFNPQDPTPSNPGFFLNPVETSRSVMALAASFDIFALWFMALLGIGLSEATGRRVKALSIFLSYFGLWAVWVLARMGLAQLG